MLIYLLPSCCLRTILRAIPGASHLTHINAKLSQSHKRHSLLTAQYFWHPLLLLCPHAPYSSHTGLSVLQTGQVCCPVRTSAWVILLPGMFFPQRAAWFTSSPPSSFTSNITFPWKPSLSILLKLYSPLTFPTLLYFSPWDLSFSNMLYIYLIWVLSISFPQNVSSIRTGIFVCPAPWAIYPSTQIKAWNIVDTQQTCVELFN